MGSAAPEGAMSLYLVLDGPDGCGKTSQAEALCQWLRAAGAEVLHIREPGSTPVGEAIRDLLLDPDTGHLAVFTEALLFYAARAELIQKQVAPALRAGHVVVAERCYLSTVVYQGLAPIDGPGISVALLDQLTAAVHRTVLPDAVFVLDVAPEVGAARRERRDEDRIESRGEDYQCRVRQGFLDAASRDDRIHVVDANGPLDVVQEELRRRVKALGTTSRDE